MKREVSMLLKIYFFTTIKEAVRTVWSSSFTAEAFFAYNIQLFISG